MMSRSVVSAEREQNYPLRRMLSTSSHAEVREAGESITRAGDIRAVMLEGILDESECAELVSLVYSHRTDWTVAFDGENQQYSLGEAYYPHFDMSSIEDYFRKASASNDLLTRLAPSLHPRLLDAVKWLTGAHEVHLRKGWAGPGIVIFPAGGRCARTGGPIHVDWEAIPNDRPQSRTLPLSFILMLGKPDGGGGLRIWGSEGPSGVDPSDMPLELSDSILLDYSVGDLVCIRALWPHKIEAFEGEKDRICLTFHAMPDDEGWCVWF